MSRKTPRILLVEFTGEVTEARVEMMLHSLRDMALAKQAVCAVVLRLNSSGGSLGAAQSFISGMACLREELSAPLICFAGEQALSAAFYIALSGDELMVTKSALLGNVGTVLQYYSLARLASRFDIDVQTFSSGMHKAALSPFGTLAELQALAVQQLLDETTGHFLDWIRLKRPAATLTAAQCQQLSAIVTGARCLDWKLADTEGGLFDAIQRAATLCDVSSPTLLRVNFSEQALTNSLKKRVMQFIFEKVFTSQ